MELGNKLKEQGWHLTDDGIKKLIAAAGSENVRKIITTALDLDFREIAGGALPSKRGGGGGGGSSAADDSIPGRIVLQVTKVRNISAPKSNEDSKAAPRFLQLELTDGVSSVQALELERVESLNLNVPPGTKIHFRAERLQLMQGFVVLRGGPDLQVLGGRVEALVEKWELARSMLKYAKSGRRMSGASGPPPWIVFGKKTDALKETPLANQRNFKSLQAAAGIGGGDKDKDSKENEEFNAMRTEAIAVASKAGAKKVFGGGTQQILDHNVKKILEKGYTEEDAKNALRSTNNNLERALYNLKRRFEHNKRYEDEAAETTAAPSSGFRRGGGPRELGGGRRGAASLKDEANAAKPATNVSLFDFLTDKLPTSTETTTATTSSASTYAPTQSAPPAAVAATTSTSSSSNYRNPFHAPTASRFDKSRPDVGASKINYGSSNNAPNKPSSRDSDTSRPKFENNISSSFAANRPRGGGGRGRGGSGGGERESFSYDERPSNSRYPSSGARGGRGGGGRGSSSASYQSGGGSRQNYEEPPTETAATTTTNSKPARVVTSFIKGSGNPRRASHVYPSATSSSSGGGGAATAPMEGSGAAHENRRSGNDRSERFGNFSEGHKSGGGGGFEKNRFNQRENSGAKNYSSGNQRQQNSHNNNSGATAATANTTSAAAAAPNSSTNNGSSNTDKIMNKLVETTSKMKLTETETKPNTGRQQQQRGHQQHRQQQQQHHTQQSQSQQQQQYSQPPPPQPNPIYMSQLGVGNNNSSGGSSSNNNTNNNNPFSSAQQLPNGFTYDPSKIIGFQNKETNEFAMTLLKSQGVPAAVAATTPAAAGNSNSPAQQSTANTSSGYVSPHGFHNSSASSANFMMPSPPIQRQQQQQQPQQQQYGMVAGDFGWLWKCGDLCLAKYWDDGRYYEAEITAISDKTCVVFFLGYGNHEEVLKSDLLPITDAQNRPINTYTAPPTPQQQHQQQQQQLGQLAPQQQQQQQQAPHAFQRGVPGGGAAQRHRGSHMDRQMYVPPARRDN